MKRIKYLFSFAFVLMLMVTFSVAASAEETEYTSGVFTYTVIDGEATITGCDKSVEGHLVVPETLDGYKVTTFARYAFLWCDKITDITIPESLTYYESLAFPLNMEGFHVKSIEAWIKTCETLSNAKYSPWHPMYYFDKFYVGDELLTDIVIPEGVAVIPDSTFYGIDSVKSVTFHSGVEKIGKNAFYECYGIESLYVPDIDFWLNIKGGLKLHFENKKLNNLYIAGELLTDYTVPDSVTELPDYAFTNYAGLKSVTLHDKITSIGKNAFSGCINLESVYVPSIESWLNTDFVTGTSNPLCNNAKLYIDGELFENFVVDEKSTSVPANTFVNYGYLKSVTLHENITSIGGNAFSGCTNLESVYAPSLESWLNIDFGSERANPLCNGAKLYIDGVLLENLRVPESISEIKQYVFYGYGCLKIFEITDNLLKIGDSAFSSACKDMKVHAETVMDWLDINVYSSGNPLKYGADIYIDGEKPTEVVIPEGVKEFSAASFDYWRSLKKITIPTTAYIYHNFDNTSIEEVVVGSLTEKIKPVKTITYLLFRDNKKIKKITFGYGVKSIGEKAFEGMTNLKEVVFYDGIEEIGVRAFCDTGITSITIPSTVKSVKGGAFAYCDKLAEITLGDVLGAEPVMNIENETFRNCPELAKVTFNSGVKGIGAFTFSNSLKKMENVYINDLESYLNIKTPEDGYYGQYALPTRWSDNVYVNGEILKNLVIPEGITCIGSSAFANVETLETVKFPSTLKEIHADAFASCWNLKDFTLPESLEKIGEFAFFSCSLLTKLELKKNVKDIGMSAFEYCKGLKTVYMYPEMMAVGECVFGECKNIEIILYTGTKEAWDKLLAQNKNTGLEGVAVYYRFRPESMYAPKNISASQTANTITVSWSQISGVTGYRLYVKNANGWKTVKTLSNTTYKITGLKSGTRYTYAVKAYISSGTFVLWSPEYITIDTATKTVKPSKVTSAQNTSAIRLNWTACPGATGYAIYRKSGNNWAFASSTTSATTHTFSGLKAGTKYTYAVRPYIHTNSGLVWSDYTVIDTSTQAVKPSKVTATMSTGEIRLTWTKCAGATGYRIYYKSGNTWKVAVSTTSATSHTFSGLKAGAKYTFAVRPYIKIGNAVIWSDYTQFMTATNPATVTAKVSSPSKGKISLSWNAVNGADGYQVYYKTGNGSYKLYKVVGAGTRSMSFQNLKSGTKYTFAIRAEIKTSGGNIFGGYKTATVTVK